MRRTLGLLHALRWRQVSAALGIASRVEWSDILTTSSAVGVALTLLDGTTADDVEKALDRVCSFYRCADGKVERSHHRHDKVRLWLYFSQLDQHIQYPFGRSHSIVPPRETLEIPLGVGLSGETLGVRLFDRGIGGSSLLIGGVPGSGKTNALRVVMTGLAQTPTTLLLIDPTGGAEAHLWSHRVSASVVTGDAGETAELLEGVLRLISRRGHLLGRGISRDDLLPVCLICDELAELGAASTPKEQEHVRAQLRRVVSLGRKANVACVFATQRTTAASIDVTTRSLVAKRLALPHPGDPHGSEALLGPGKYEAARLSARDRGLGYLSDGGEPQLLRVFALSEAEVAQNALGPMGPSLGDLELWDDVLARSL